MAHRLSTIVDIIFMVHDGVIAAKGTHEELLKSCDFYANLIRGWIEYDSDLFGWVLIVDVVSGAFIAE